jgi:PAS domain S-box-containing protein
MEMIMASRSAEIERLNESELIEQLRKKEALYRALVNTSPDAILVTDLEATILMANSRAAEIYRFRQAEDLVGLRWFDLMAPGERERAADNCVCVVQQKCLRDQEYVLQRRDGSTFPAEVSAALIRETDGQPRSIIAVVRDISDRKAAEKRLRERDAQYRSIVEATSDGLIINDLDGYAVEANPAACAMHGYSHEEFIGLHRTAYVHRDYHDALPGYIKEIEETGSIHVRGVNIRKDGRAFPVDIRGTTFLYRGKPHILALVRDVTEQLKAQELLEQRVTERTRQLSTLLEVSRQVASTLRFEPLIGLILDQLKEVVDYRGGGLLKLVGDDLVIVEYRGPNPRDEVVGLRFRLADIGPIWESANMGQPRIIRDVRGNDPAARAFRKAAGPLLDGAWSYMRSWMGIPMVQKGKLMGILSLSTDQPSYYTLEHVRLVQALASQAAVAMENAKLYAQAQEAAALEERARLARELHDSITQSLFSMTMHAEAAQIARDREVGAERATPLLDRNLRELHELTEAALAEMRALIFELRPGALQEEGLAAALRKHAAAVSAREGVAIRVHAPGDRLPIDSGIEEHLYRCAQEALHNVIKHARAAHTVIRLCSGPDGRLAVEVEDDGQGFDPGAIPAGHLGLRTMADRVEQIGGTLEINSAPGAGTRVRVTLSPGWNGEGTEDCE